MAYRVLSSLSYNQFTIELLISFFYCSINFQLLPNILGKKIETQSLVDPRTLKKYRIVKVG